MENKPGILRQLFSHALLIINILTVIWSAFCFAAAYVSPANTRYIAITTIGAPFVIVANIFFVIFWLFFSQKRLRTLLSLVTLAACYKVFITVFGLNFFAHNDMSQHSNTIKIMSWNVHGMGIFQRHGVRNTAGAIMDEIHTIDPDIVCLPEYYTPKEDSMQPYANEILQRNNFKEYRFCFDNTLGPDIYLGTAIFSKYPLQNYVVHHIGNEWINVLQFDVRLKSNKMVRMFVLHMHSFGLSDYDKYFIEELKKRTIVGGRRAGVMLWKFNYAYGMRANEADTVLKFIRQSPYPVFVCGDFNDLPGSYTYTVIRGDLKDAFLEKGRGLGRTFNELSPTLRIDHMLYDPSVLKPIGFKCPRIYLSDHRPIIGNFEMVQ